MFLHPQLTVDHDEVAVAWPVLDSNKRNVDKSVEPVLVDTC